MSLNVIMTGATGFIGSYLCREILDNGGKAVCIVRKNSPNISRLPKHPNLIPVDGDLDDMLKWQDSLLQLNMKFDVCYHLAWKGVGNQVRNDAIQYSNIKPALESLHLAKMLGCSKWIGAGSQAEYGSIDNRIAENAPTNPTTLYGASKLAAYHLTNVAGKQLGINTSWVRIFSTYGPGDNTGWMLTDLIRHLLEGKSMKLTPGEQLWDYLYVSDAAKAFYQLGCASRSGGLYNLGSGSAYQIKRIVEMARDLIDPAFPLAFGETPYRPDQVMHLEADITKLTADTGWRPSVDIRSGIAKLIDFVKKS